MLPAGAKMRLCIIVMMVCMCTRDRSPLYQTQLILKRRETNGRLVIDRRGGGGRGNGGGGGGGGAGHC